MARRQTARPLPAWVGDLSVFERTLANGFKALVLPRSHAPLVVCDLYYPVGSVDEPAGRSGLAHFVEHMLFMGTERLPKGQIDRLAFVAAGQSNAETGEDCTHYWFAFPSDRLRRAFPAYSCNLYTELSCGSSAEVTSRDACATLIGSPAKRSRKVL